MFLAPAMLAGLLAIALPVWLHRMALANPTRHPFASLMFLRQSETQRTAKRTIRYWLLLALRIAFLAVLALAFAGPLLSPERASVVAADSRLHAIVIDQSLSMQAGDRWQKALEQADAIIAAAQPGDQLTLVAASGRRIEVLHDHLPLRDAGVIRASLQKLKPGVDRLDYGLLMTTASGWLTTPRLPTQLHLISDMQQSASPLRFADLQPPQATQIQIHDVSSGETSNSYVDDLTVGGDQSSISATVKTSSVTSLPANAVLTIDDKEVARRPVQFPGAASIEATRTLAQGEGAAANRQMEADVQFTGLALSAGAHRVMVSLDPVDSLPEDDRLYAMIEQTKPRVMLVSRGTNSDEAAYFNAAIGSLTAPQLDVQQQPAQELTERRLKGAALVVESDVAALSADALAALDAYVAGGGSVLMTLASGSAAKPSNMLAGLRFGDVVTTGAQVSQVQLTHPVLRPSGSQSDDWHRVQFFKHLRITPAEGDDVLVSLEDGSPLLIERQVGAGRALLLAAPLNREWNDLAIHPLFIRFIADAARYLIGRNAVSSAARVGAPAFTGLTASATGQIFDPQGKRVLALGDASSVDRFVPTQAGFHEVRSSAGEKWLAVNVDRRESPLERMSPASVQRWLALRPQLPVTGENRGPDATASQLTAGRSLGYLLLILAALLGAAELLMANHYLIVRRDAKAVA